MPTVTLYRFANDVELQQSSGKPQEHTAGRLEWTEDEVLDHLWKHLTIPLFEAQVEEIRDCRIVITWCSDLIPEIRQAFVYEGELGLAMTIAAVWARDTGRCSSAVRQRPLDREERKLI